MNIPVYETKPFEQNDKKMWRGGYYDICYEGGGGQGCLTPLNSVISWRSVLLVEETVAASH